MLQTATTGELMLQDVCEASRRSPEITSIHFFFFPCVAVLSRIPAPTLVFLLFFSRSLSYAHPFNPSLATLSRRQPFYNPSLSRLLFTLHFFSFLFLNFSRLLSQVFITSVTLVLWHFVCVCVCVFYPVYLYPSCPQVCLGPSSLSYHFFLGAQAFFSSS